MMNFLRNRKTLLRLCLWIFLILLLSSCSQNVREIENYEWKMDRALYTNDGEVTVKFVDEATDLAPNAEGVQVSFEASDGNWVLTDLTNEKTYGGRYSAKDSYVYDMTSDDASGYAVVSVTVYDDGSERPTLCLVFEPYTLYFYAE